jgi:prepilin-type N-terminal cleavage/methylation domain-containing protein
MRATIKKGPTPREAGFTLLEVIAAIAILCFGLLAVASMQTGAIQGNYTARIQTEATTWAQDRMERLLAQSYTDLSTLPPGQATQDIYTIQWNVANGAVPNTLLVTVTVTWQDKGFTRTNTLTCVKPNL